MTPAKELVVWFTAHWEQLAIASVYVIAAAFLLAWLVLWTKESWRRYRILRAHREAQRQLRAMQASREYALTHTVVSERRKDAA